MSGSPQRPGATRHETTMSVAWTDVLLVVALLVFGVGGTAPAAASENLPPPTPAMYALIVLACIGVVFWRWRPMWTLAITGPAIAGYLALGAAHGPILVTGLLAVYSVATRYPLRRAIGPVGVVLALMSIGEVVRVGALDRTWFNVAAVIAWVLAPFSMGVSVGARRNARAQVKAEQSRRLLADERLRMAGEVHDVVGHGLAVIAMQSGVALHVLDRDPQRAREALEAIRATSKESLDDLRAELDAIRQNSDQLSRSPHAGIAEIDPLIDRIRAGGMEIDWHAAVDTAHLLPGVEQAAYRIVQEALTNVLKHAGPEATVRARLYEDGGKLHVEVHDSGAGAGPGHQPGVGLAGMQQRAESLGGQLQAQNNSDRGFTVLATLPVTKKEATG